MVRRKYQCLSVVSRSPIISEKLSICWSQLINGYLSSLRRIWKFVRWRCWRLFLPMLFISGRLNAVASEIQSNSPVIICWGVFKEVSGLLLILALTFITSTFVCVGAVYGHFLPIKTHHSRLSVLLPYNDLFFLARILMALLCLVGPFGTHIRICFGIGFLHLFDFWRIPSHSIYVCSLYCC